MATFGSELLGVVLVIEVLDRFTHSYSSRPWITPLNEYGHIRWSGPALGNLMSAAELAKKDQHGFIRRHQTQEDGLLWEARVSDAVHWILPEILGCSLGD